MENSYKKDFITNFAFIVSCVLLMWFCLFILKTIIPFVIGYFVAFMLKPITVKLVDKTKFRRKGAAFFVILFFYICIATLLWLFGISIYSQTANLFSKLPDIYNQNIEPFLYNINIYFSNFINNISPDTSNTMNSIFKSLSSSISNMLLNISHIFVDSVTNFAKHIPIFFITLIFSIVCSILICMDYNTVTAFFFRQFSKKTGKVIIEIKNFLLNTLAKMLRAYFIIFIITFVELLCGLIILKVQYAVPIALIIAIFDIAPFFGTGGILIPWALYSMATQNFMFGTGLLIMYLLVTAIRNIIEPKIVGTQIGLNPIVTITAMYAGLRLIGIIGIFLAPIIVLLVKYLNEKHIISLYK